MNGSSALGSMRRGWSALVSGQGLSGGAAQDVADLHIGQVLLAVVMIALGIRGFVYGDFASVWQRVPIEHLPTREFFIYACATIELATGVGLLLKRAVAISSCVLSVYMLLWLLLLRVPGVLAAPLMEATWLGVGEIGVILAGAWTIFAMQAAAWSGNTWTFLTGANGVRYARALFVLSLPMIGLSHFVYAKETAHFVPGWIPWPYACAYLTGAGSIVASMGILFRIYPRLATTLEAAMLSVITVLVWLPGLIAKPADDSWTPFLMSSAIACGAWAVADAYRGLAWSSVGKTRMP